MAITGVSVEKDTLFRGVQQNFSNVYYYLSDLGVDLESQAAQLGDGVVAVERDLHSSSVNFLRLRVWSAGGTPAQNTMLHEKALTGTGIDPPQANIDKERAFLVQWPAGKSVTGKPVYLRKWFHHCGQPGASLITDAVLANTAELPTAIRTGMQTIAGRLSIINTTYQGYELGAKSGRRRQGDPIVHAYLEHHQLGDEWRNQLSATNNQSEVLIGATAFDFYTATLNFVQILLLAWIGSEQAASRRERVRRSAHDEERRNHHQV